MNLYWPLALITHSRNRLEPTLSSMANLISSLGHPLHVCADVQPDTLLWSSPPQTNFAECGGTGKLIIQMVASTNTTKHLPNAQLSSPHWQTIENVLQV
jgi:hypothetical protein